MARPTVRARWTATFNNVSTSFRVVMADASGGTYHVETRRTDHAGGESWEEFETYTTTSADKPLPAMTKKVLAGMFDAIFSVT